MLRSALTGFFRTFTRHPLYGLLNLLGLSFGIAVFITLSLLYRFESSYENWSSERQHVYAVGTRFHFTGVPSELVLATMGDLLPEMKSAWPQVEGTRDYSDYFIVHTGGDVFTEHMEFVDANFLTFFNVPVLRGDAATALTDPSRVVLSARVARKYFGTIDVVGRTMTLSTDDGIKPYVISAVIADLPKNSDMQLDMLRYLSPQFDASTAGWWRAWGGAELRTYLKFRQPADAARFSAQLPAFVDRQAGPTFGPGVTAHKMVELSLVPLAGAHLISPTARTAVATLSLVGILALGLALINYVNLATARAGLRAREVAVRKALGAPPSALRTQFLVEAGLTLVLAFLVALSAVELGLPVIDAVGGQALALDYRADGLWLLAILGIVLLVGLVAALYPAFVLSAFKPAQVLASSRTPGGGRAAGRLRTGLAMLQFTAVVVALVLMAGFSLQIRHMETADLGFDRARMLMVGGLANPLVTPPQREAFVTAARALPGVKYASLADIAPGPGMSGGGFVGIVRPGQKVNPAQAPTVQLSTIGPDYFKMMSAHLLAGRLFDPQHADDQMISGPDDAKSGRVMNLIISRRAVTEMGFASPRAAIGQLARFGNQDGPPLRIVGVVDDMRLKSPNAPIPAQAYMFDVHATYSAGMVRYEGVSEAAIRKGLAAVWRQINPNVPLDADDVAEQLDSYYKPDRERSRLFDIGTGIAALIGCIGLYGMAAFNAGRRVREIGMRKVLGASRGAMVRLLLLQFLRPVLVASLIAWPLAWIALRRWLAQFDDVIAVPLWLFPSASIAALLIALVTVAGIAFAAAGTEPGKALRHE